MLSGGGLLAYGLTITFASFDWLMSLEPHWFSTIYGVLIMGGQGLTALAFLIVVLVWLSRRPPLDRDRRAGALPRPRQPDARVRDAVGVLLVLAVPDHLVGQPAGRDRLVHAPAADRLALRRRRAGRRSISPCRSCCCCRGRSSASRSCSSRSRSAILVVRLVDLFWLIAPEFHHDGHRRQLARRRAAAVARRRSGSAASSGSCAAARFCRFTIRSSTKRSGRSSSAAANRAEDGALSHGERRTSHAATTRRRITRRATSTSAAILGFGARPGRRRGRRRTSSSGCCSAISTRREDARAARRRIPLAAAQERPRCRRSRGCRPTRAQDLSDLRAQRRRRCSTATAGWTRTPASSAFRSTRR